jgi:hypothetical protein
MIEGAEGMTHVLPEATGDPPHLLEQPSIVARCGGMIEPTGAPSSPAGRTHEISRLNPGALTG